MQNEIVTVSRVGEVVTATSGKESLSFSVMTPQPSDSMRDMMARLIRMLSMFSEGEKVQINQKMFYELQDNAVLA